MALDTPHNSQPNPSMSFPRESVGPSNGLSSSQPNMGSFNAAQSVASTPAATPPPPRASQQSNVSYSFPNSAMSQGSVGRNSSFGGYDENNGIGSMASYQGNNAPQIYRVRFLGTYFVTEGSILVIFTNYCLLGCVFKRVSLRDGSQWCRGYAPPF